jgi:hypothetical protein
MEWIALRVGETTHFRIYAHELADADIIGGGKTEEAAWESAAKRLLTKPKKEMWLLAYPGHMFGSQRPPLKD